MSEPVEALILDLLEWLGPAPRPYAEVMEAWRTSCPRLPVWEDANERGLVERRRTAGSGELVSVSPEGRAYLRERRAGVSASG
jgi:D-3-phosphoglycerate dehydrogenase